MSFTDIHMIYNTGHTITIGKTRSILYEAYFTLAVALEQQPQLMHTRHTQRTFNAKICIVQMSFIAAFFVLYLNECCLAVAQKYIMLVLD
ncbi:hypothetical protein GDO78_005625 [Eleutherodactylus coqui]|uniref:Uncharacterized protein n=1 Tax=Eleutherodactylus coqui TaxID=57060 RepID=A0A8J6FNB7_ELECQ|nr:hypothetical protein GDO78_005625 [Eleutherodactylus coqui]